jgi:hypothetical protein
MLWGVSQDKTVSSGLPCAALNLHTPREPGEVIGAGQITAAVGLAKPELGLQANDLSVAAQF